MHVGHAHAARQTLGSARAQCSADELGRAVTTVKVHVDLHYLVRTARAKVHGVQRPWKWCLFACLPVLLLLALLNSLHWRRRAT